MNVKLTRNVAGQKPGDVLDLDTPSAAWMVANGYAEPVDAAPQPEAEAPAPVKRTRTPRKSQKNLPETS